MYSQGWIVGQCLSTAKYGRPNYPAYSKHGVWPKNRLKPVSEVPLT